MDIPLWSQTCHCRRGLGVICYCLYCYDFEPRLPSEQRQQKVEASAGDSIIPLTSTSTLLYLCGSKGAEVKRSYVEVILIMCIIFHSRPPLLPAFSDFCCMPGKRHTCNSTTSTAVPLEAGTQGIHYRRRERKSRIFFANKRTSTSNHAASRTLACTRMLKMNNTRVGPAAYPQENTQNHHHQLLVLAECRHVKEAKYTANTKFIIRNTWRSQPALRQGQERTQAHFCHNEGAKRDVQSYAKYTMHVLVCPAIRDVSSAQPGAAMPVPTYNGF